MNDHHDELVPNVPSLEWAPLRADDLGDLAELRLAIDYFEDPPQTRSAFDLQRDYESQPDASANAVVGREQAGAIVAYGWNLIDVREPLRPRIWLDNGIHPAWRHQNIGSRLLEWHLDRARRWYHDYRSPGVGSLWVGQAVDHRSHMHTRLLENGFEPQRWLFDSHVDLNARLPEPREIAGVRIVPYEPAMSEHVRMAHNEAFGTKQGSAPVDRQEWERDLSRPDARPEWSWVALADTQAHEHGGVVGYAINSLTGDDQNPEGWTERLGTCPAWRGRGIGAQLLLASMRSFLDAGLQGAGVGVDTDRWEEAGRLFASIGYRSTDMMIVHGRYLED